MSDVVLILAGGSEPPTWAIGDLDPELVIAADGGAAHARRLDLAPDLVVGDLDSASPELVDWVIEQGGRVVEHSSDKDKTDLELALDEAEGAGATRVVVVGAAGGRTDHALANWAALSAPRPFSVEVRDEGGITHIVTEVLELDGQVGDPISLIPWGGSATVTTHGLRWPLAHAELSPFSALGISNEFVAEAVAVTVSSGVVLVVQPVES